MVPFISITETWLKDYIADAQLQIPNYSLVRADRDKRRGGGALLYIHSSLTYEDVSIYSDGSCEAVICTLDRINSVIASVYRPPDACSTKTKNLLSFLDKYLTSSESNGFKDLMITGDFNLPNINWETCSVLPTHGAENSESANQLLNFMNKHFLTQVVKSPTRKDNILDIVMVNNDRIISHVSTSETRLSDHNLVSVKLTYNPSDPITHPLPDIEKHSFRAVDFHSCDFEVINSKLQEINWEDLQALCDNEDDQDGSMFLSLFNLTVLQIFLANAPPKPQGKDVLKNKFSRNRRVLNRKRRQLSARLRALQTHSPSSPKIGRIKLELSTIHIKIRDSHVDQVEARESEAVKVVKSNPRYFFSYAKRFAKSKSSIGPLKTEDGSLTQDCKEMADILQRQYMSVFSDPKSEKKKMPTSDSPYNCKLTDVDFTCDDVKDAIKEIDINAACSPDDIPAKILHKCCDQLAQPIWRIWKNSLESGIIPPDLKMQYISPIFKKGDKAKAANYRPISLTSHIIKIFERILRKNIILYLETNNIITDTQHGFRSGRSCFTQLLDHMENIFQNLQDNKEVDVIYLDYAKAFDKVDHEILLAKLEKLGINGKLLQWIRDFLSNNRFQTVLINGKRSFLASVLSGVPQGSVLGPLLFLVYINDLVEAIQQSKISSFADDTKISRAIEYCKDLALLQSDLDQVIKWSIENNMDLHEDKFEVISYKINSSSSLKELPFSYCLHTYETSDGNDIAPSPLVKDLGVNLTPDCKWTTHINIIANNAKKMASWVLGTFKDRSKFIMTLLFKSMVRSRLEYCSALWNPHKVQDIQTIEAIQRSFTSRISGCEHMNYWERLKYLDLPSLQRRRERYIIINTWKILLKKSPNDINMIFYHSDRLGIRAKVPPLAKNCPLAVRTLCENSFSVKAARLWNLLPKTINTIEDLDVFKAALGDYLGKVPDQPPTPGYVTTCSNSLLDWNIQSGGLRDVRWP